MDVIIFNRASSFTLNAKISTIYVFNNYIVNTVVNISEIVDIATMSIAAMSIAADKKNVICFIDNI